jgi:hypothetical protein
MDDDVWDEYSDEEEEIETSKPSISANKVVTQAEM